ncbi:glucose-6-phosphate isomerase [Anopheles sinensis]|uniref:Glucose-6-phosphate isomerase n=1 Tax=Anopheles sinensis TaxID=74873 RepID=A0A084WRV7_ANOSI|nr:glucose-6-phosphate isomerase [Anopheles sinensis]
MAIDEGQTSTTSSCWTGTRPKCGHYCRDRLDRCMWNWFTVLSRTGAQEAAGPQRTAKVPSAVNPTSTTCNTVSLDWFDVRSMIL